MNFSELLDQARAGSPDAVQALYTKYSRPVLTLVRRRLSPALRRKCDSVDLLQSVFAEVLRDLSRIEDRGEVAFRHWLYIKTTNKVHGKLRRYFGRGGHRAERLLDSTIDMPTDEVGPDAHAERRESAANAATVFDTLDGDARVIVRLRLDDGLSFRDIADELGLASADAARKRYARAIGRLRRLLST